MYFLTNFSWIGKELLYVYKKFCKSKEIQDWIDEIEIIKGLNELLGKTQHKYGR